MRTMFICCIGHFEVVGYHESVGCAILFAHVGRVAASCKECFKGLCHKDIAVLGQFCAKVIT